MRKITHLVPLVLGLALMLPASAAAQKKQDHCLLSSDNDMEDERRAEAELAPCLTPMIARLAEPYREAIELTHKVSPKVKRRSAPIFRSRA